MELGYKRSEMKERVRWRDWESVLQGTLRSYNILGLHQAGWKERERERDKKRLSRVVSESVGNGNCSCSATCFS